MGKVAIIRDMGAVTYVKSIGNWFSYLTGLRSFEAMLCFLYTGEIKFAPFSSDPRREFPTQARTGDWSAGRLPSASAKSIYRLADMVTILAFFGVPEAHRFQYDIPALKKQAEVCIHDNLQNCNIVEEVFSSFSSL